MCYNRVKIVKCYKRKDLTMSKQFELLKKIGFVRVGGSAEELKAAQMLKPAEAAATAAFQKVHVICEAEKNPQTPRILSGCGQVKVGDVIEINFGQRTVKVEVLGLSESAKKEDAAAMYKEVL